MRQKDILVPWTANCTLCKTLETADHVFIHCWGAVFLFSETDFKKKDLYINSHTIQFLPVQKPFNVPYDMQLLLGLNSIWWSQMAVPHAGQGPPCIQTVRSQEMKPDWSPVLRDLIEAKRY